MIRKIVLILAAMLVLSVAAVPVSAQDVLMNSAETINKGNFKVALFPLALLGKNGGEALWGVAGRVGYGLTERFDIEAKGAILQDLNYFGADAEYWLVQGKNANVSVALGGHMTNSKGGADSSGLDASLLFSTSPVKLLEFYAGLKVAFDSMKNSDQTHTIVHLIPGIEYRLSSDLDLLAEIGIALNDYSRSYVSVGLALYLR